MKILARKTYYILIFVMFISFLNCARKSEKVFVSGIVGQVQDIQLISIRPDAKGLTYVVPVIKDVLTPWMVCVDSEIVGVYDMVNFCGWLKSEDGGYLPVYGVSAGNKSFAVVGTSEKEKYNFVGSDRELVITISEDSSSYVYRARTDSAEFVVINDRSDKPYEIVGRPVISKEKGVVAYKAYKKGRWYIVFDGKEFGPYEAVGQPVVSPDGTSFAFIAAVGGRWQDQDYLGGKWFIVVNGKMGKRYDWVWNPVFSDDGKHIAYRASVGGKWLNKSYSGGKWFVVVDGKEIGDFTSTADPIFTKKNNIVSFIGTKADGWYIVLGDKEFGPFSYVDRFNPALNKNSDDIVYTASIGGNWSGNKYYGGKWFVVFNGQMGRQFDCIWVTPQFDTVNNIIGYVGSDGGAWDSTGYYGGNYFMVLSDGEKEIISSSLPIVHSFRFSPYRKGAYVIILQPQKDKFRLLFFDGAKPIYSSTYDGIQDIVFHPSGKSLLMIVSSNRKWKLINLTENGEKDILTYAFIARPELENNGRMVRSLVLDGKKNQALIVKTSLE